MRAVWYIRKGKLERGKKALKFLVGNVEGYDLDHEFEVIRTQVEVSNAVSNSHSKNKWKAFFQWPNLRRAIAAALPLTCQQNSGTAYIYSYTTYLQVVHLSSYIRLHTDSSQLLLGWRYQRFPWFHHSQHYLPLLSARLALSDRASRSQKSCPLWTGYPRSGQLDHWRSRIRHIRDRCL